MRETRFLEIRAHMNEKRGPFTCLPKLQMSNFVWKVKDKGLEYCAWQADACRQISISM
jgi:hypothetical protein